MKKEEKIIYSPGSLSTLNGFEKRFEKIERRMDQQGESICIHTKIIGLLQEAVYRDEKKELEKYLCRNCPYKKELISKV